MATRIPLPPIEAAILRGLVARCEDSEDCWGVDTAVREYLADAACNGDHAHDDALDYLHLVAGDVWYHFGHVGEDDDRESAQRAERSVRRAMRWIELFRSRALLAWLERTAAQPIVGDAS